MRSSRPPWGGSPPAALPALLRATHLLGLALGSALGRLRESGATVARLFERAEESPLLLRMTRETATILGARWDKVHERYRPHYGPEQRFRILRIRASSGSTRNGGDVSSVVRDDRTVETETTRSDVEAPRPLVAPNLPVRRFADVVRALVKTMELAGFGGNDLIAQTLARAGWKLSSRTVGRIRKSAGRTPEPRSGVDGSAGPEGKASESRLDGGPDGCERAVRDRDVQGGGCLRCVLADAALGQGVFQGGLRASRSPGSFRGRHDATDGRHTSFRIGLAASRARSFCRL